MRLSESKIRSGITHPDQFVRDAAVSYFSTSLSSDREIMPVAIQAVQEYGYQAAFSDIEVLQPLVQTDQTVSWLVSEFDRLGDDADRKTWEYLSALSWILAEADASLLKRRRADVLGVRLLDSDARETIQERTRLLSVSGDASWRELKEFCDQASSGDTSSRPSVSRAFHLVEAVARQADKFADRVISVLVDTSDRAGDLGRAWLQLLMIRAAGRMRLHEAVAVIVEELKQEHQDWVYEECVLALTRIGSDDAVKAVWNACAVAEPGFVSTASWVLESIHSDLAMEAALRLLEQEEDPSLKMYLGHALLAQFEVDGLAPVRHLLLNHPPDEETVELRNNFVAVCTLMDAEIPELENWREAIRQEQSFRAQWQNPEFPVEDWSSHLASEPTAKKRDEPLMPPLRIPKIPQPRVGRNEPCPCKSGKKYKHCCLRR